MKYARIIFIKNIDFRNPYKFIKIHIAPLNSKRIFYCSISKKSINPVLRCDELCHIPWTAPELESTGNRTRNRKRNDRFCWFLRTVNLPLDNMQEQHWNVVHSMKEIARQAEEEPAVREEKGKEEKEGRDRFRALESFSPSQHRPLNSTPLVETKSDTRKAKLLQMYKPSSVRFLSLPSLAHTDFSLFVSLFPPLGSLQPPERPFLVSRRRFLVPSFDFCSFQLLTYTQSTLFIAKTSFCNSPFPLPSSSVSRFFSAPLAGPLCAFLPFFPCSRTFHFLVSDLFSPLSQHQRKLLPSFLSLHSRSRFARVSLFPEGSSRLTSDYLTPLINSRPKSLGFGLFHDTRPSLKTRKVEWCLSLFTSFCERRSIRKISM